jgi:Uma2 family endonuclease
MNDAVFDWRGEYDENLPLPAQLTMEQYRRVIFRPDAHFVDGKIVPRVLGDTLHGTTVGALAVAFDTITASTQLSACISLRLHVSPTCVRVCDLVLLQKPDRVELVPTTPPFLCAEVLAEGQQAESEIGTLTDYRDLGVQNIWLLDPNSRQIYTFGEDGLNLVSHYELQIAELRLRFHVDTLFIGGRA